MRQRFCAMAVRTERLDMIEARRRPSFDIVASSRALEIHSGLASVSMTLCTEAGCV